MEITIKINGQALPVEVSIEVYTYLDQAANERLESLMQPMTKAAGITEQLKATDQMRWVGLMNAVKAQVEEIIFTELFLN